MKKKERVPPGAVIHDAIRAVGLKHGLTYGLLFGNIALNALNNAGYIVVDFKEYERLHAEKGRKA